MEKIYCSHHLLVSRPRIVGKNFPPRQAAVVFKQQTSLSSCPECGPSAYSIVLQSAS